MPLLLLFYRLMVRPLFREPVRTSLTILAIGLGVAVVLAIDLAGGAATGSFRSSMETLAGDNDLEVRASGGVPESVVGTLATLPYLIRVSPRIEDYAVIAETKKSLPLIGLDLVAEGSAYAQRDSEKTGAPQIEGGTENVLEQLGDADSIWVGSSTGYKTDDHVELLINDRVRNYTVRGVYPDSNGNESAIVMDLTAAQHALARFGRVDRILLKVPQTPSLEEWQQRLQTVLPAGVEVRPQGTGTNENRRMLAAFRWNLRLLSYISLVVGAFLIYNTISVSVVRRRPEIGIVRALGASRGVILFAFVGEAVCFGLAGAFIALPLGRFMATGAVRLMASTVESLYVSSRPGPIELSPASALLALAIGVGVAVASSYSPALAASLRRTSVLVGALSTAIAMMTSVGIMVGSFRQTVLFWMSDRLSADLYLRPAGVPAADRHPTISLELAQKIEKLPGVAAVDRLRAYEISYEGMPATLASVDSQALRRYPRSNFFSGRRTDQVLSDLRDSNAIIVSEPFSYKHH